MMSMRKPSPCLRADRPARGFTLLEVLVVVTLVGIMAALASSSWRRVMWRFQSLGAADEFRGTLMLARSDARTSQSHSGVFFDVPNKRYLRFVDSTNSDEHDGRYTVGERILQDWRPLPPKLLVYDVQSSIAPSIPLRPCNGTAPPVSATAQSTTFSVVFKPNGQCMATFFAKFGIESFPSDTFRIEVLPPTGLVTMEN
jgi:prepilin-type N-terminal cleavage/methylation domain-containing protein